MREVLAIESDTVDLICLRYYGRTGGVTEAVYNTNPGLADLGPILPRNTRVRLPDIAPKPEKRTVKLWD